MGRHLFPSRGFLSNVHPLQLTTIQAGRQMQMVGETFPRLIRLRDTWTSEQEKKLAYILLLLVLRLILEGLEAIRLHQELLREALAMMTILIHTVTSWKDIDMYHHHHHHHPEN